MIGSTLRVINFYRNIHCRGHGKLDQIRHSAAWRFSDWDTWLLPRCMHSRPQSWTGKRISSKRQME